mgnify:CR=1 FL=1
MFSRICSRVVHVALALVLCTGAATAAPVVTATSASGLPGSTVTTTLRLAPDLAATVDMGSIIGWNLVLNWGAAPLSFDPAGSTLKFGADAPLALTGFLASLPPDLTVNHDAPGGFYRFDWADQNSGLDPQTILDRLAQGVLLSASFSILPNAAPGAYEIGFEQGAGPSSLTDATLAEFQYASVTSGDPMRVVVERSPTVPEPGGLSLMAACALAVLLVPVRRRRMERGAVG